MPSAIRTIEPAARAATTRVTGMCVVLVGEAEDAVREMDAHRLELLDELRPDAGGLQAALDLAVDDAGLLENEHVLHDDGVALHPLYLRDVHDLARAILEAGLVDDQVDRGADLLAN